MIDTRAVERRIIDALVTMAESDLEPPESRLRACEIILEHVRRIAALEAHADTVDAYTAEAYKMRDLILAQDSI